MARSFNGTTDHIQTTIGAFSAATAFGTMAFVWRSAAQNRFHGIMGAHDSGGTVKWAFEIDSTNVMAGGNDSAGSLTSTMTITTADGWVIGVYGKATGTVAPRYSKCVLSSGAWTHENGATTLANGTSPAGTGTWRFGRWQTTDFASGQLLMAAAWTGRNLADAERELLSGGVAAWLGLRPDGLWMFDQSTVTNVVADLSGGGANQNAISGTSVLLDGVPGFSYGHPYFTAFAAPPSAISQPIGVASESDAAQPITAAKRRTLGIASENGAAQAPYHAQTFADNFESGSLVTNWPTRTGNVSASTSAADTGTFGLRVSPGGGIAATVATSTTKWLQSTHTWGYISLRFRMNVLPVGTTADMFTLQNTGQLNNFDFFYNNVTGTYWLDLEGAVARIDTGVVPVIGQWHTLKAKVFFGTSTFVAEIQLDGNTYGPLLNTSQSPGFVRSFHIGTTFTTKTYEFDADTVYVKVSRTEPWLSEVLDEATETGAAQPIGHRLSRTSAPSVATESAVALGKSKRDPLGPAATVEAAQGIAARKLHAVAAATTAETAQSVGHRKAAALSAAQTVETAQTVAGGSAVAIDLANTVETAQVLAKARVRALGTTVQVDAARTLGASKRVDVGTAGQGGAAQMVAPSKARAVGTAQSIETSQVIALAGAAAPLPASISVETAQVCGLIKRRALTAAADIAFAGAINVGGTATRGALRLRDRPVRGPAGRERPRQGPARRDTSATTIVGGAT